ncbi:MAG: 2-C-methyl-D-erythritol 2,4-cyclodiphosphate synthase [Ktedonobacteraceae bacterium]
MAFASDFHAFTEGRQLRLAGVTFEGFSRGPNTKRSDGDVVAHAIVMALVAAVNKGDIEDWFSSSDDVIGVKSIEYLSEMYNRLINPEHLIIGTIDVTIIYGDQPRMKTCP